MHGRFLSTNIKRALPCGCVAWSFGGAQGVVPCPYHYHMHQHRQESLFSDPYVRGCDCLICRATDAEVDPMTYIEGLEHVARKQYERATGQDTNSEADELKTKEGQLEKDRKCRCMWLCRRGEWRLQYICADHQERYEGRDGRQRQREREQERNERGW